MKNSKINQNLIYSKIFFFSIIQAFLLAFAIYYTIKVFNNSNSFFVELDKNNPNLTAKNQADRAWAMMMGSLYILFTIIIFYRTFEINNIHIKRSILITLGCLPLINIPITFYDLLKNKRYQYWVDNYNTKNQIRYMVTLPIFFRILFNKSNIAKSKLWVNVLAYSTFTLCAIAFGFNCFLFEKTNDVYNTSNFYIFIRCSYFTQISNTCCFIYLSYFLIFKETSLVKNTAVKISVCSYISVVSSLFMIIIIPGWFLLENKDNLSVYNWITTINQHFLVPFLFIWFILIVLKKEKQTSISYAKLASRGLILPIWYCCYIFSISFATRFAPYGIATNMNPNMTTYLHGVSGNYWYSTFALLAILYFGLIIFVLWCINIKLANENIKKHLKNNFFKI